MKKYDKAEIGLPSVIHRSIPLHEIEQGENYTRLKYNEQEMMALMISMRQTGQLQAIGVTKVDDHKYRVVFGNRRFIAAQKLGWTTIDAAIFQTADEASEMIANMGENLVRVDTSLPEMGYGFNRLMVKYGMTAGEVAARVSIPVSTVKKALEAFERVPPKFRSKISHNDRARDKKGKISGEAAMRILNFQKKKHCRLSSEETETLFEQAIKKNMSREDIRLVGNFLSKGLPVEKAIENASQIKHLALELFLKKEVIERLEKEYQPMRIREILRQFLKTHKELELE